MTGGLTSEVTAVDVGDAAGAVHRLVLRRWTGQPWPDGTVDDGPALVRREAAVLSGLEGIPVPAPRLVAIDPEGAHAALPALLMTRLPGRLDLTPADPAAWTRQLADQLAQIHDIGTLPGLPAYETWLQVEDLDVPAWAGDAGLWRAALDLVRDSPTPAQGGFVHHDYQQFNVLWSGGRLAGVVDWVWASQGPPDEDLVHCRLNLCLLYGHDRATAFQDRYEAVAGRRTDPWYDVAGVLDAATGWTADGLQRQAGRRLRVDAAALPRRAEALLRLAVARAGV